MTPQHFMAWFTVRSSGCQQKHQELNQTDTALLNFAIPAGWWCRKIVRDISGSRLGSLGEPWPASVYPEETLSCVGSLYILSLALAGACCRLRSVDKASF